MLILKLTLVPLFVALIAIIGRKWGAKVAGLMSGFPVIAGPIVYFIYLEQGTEFAKTVAVSTVAGVVPLASFCFAYAWAATRLSWGAAVTFALGVYGVLVVAMVKMELTLYEAGALALMTLFVQILLSPKHNRQTGLTSASNAEVATRMLCAAGLVMAVTFFARTMGTGYSGVLAAFPIASTVIAVFSHKNHSAFHAMDSLKALKMGLISLLSFFFSLSLLAEYVNFSVAFALSSLVAVVVQYAVWVVRSYKSRSK